MRKKITVRIFVGFLIAGIGGFIILLAEFVAGKKFTYRKKDVIEKFKIRKNTN